MTHYIEFVTRRGFKNACAAFLFCAVTVFAAPAQTFISLLDFDGTNGGVPQYGSLIQGTDGNLYGVASLGGNLQLCNHYGCGTVFKIAVDGKLTTLHKFDFTDGWLAYGKLVQATDGNFYGTASGGGFSKCGGQGCGTVFKMTPEGTLTTLHKFCSKANCADGWVATAGLIQATDGNFYGTTVRGGAYDYGTVYKITSSGKLTTLHSFCAQTYCPDGSEPSAALIQATDGNFYGTTQFGGGSVHYGTVFKITATGKLTTLHRFCNQNSCPDGFYPYAGLVQAKNGDFYGTDIGGGALDGGTLFRITSAGKLTTLYSFCAKVTCSDNEQPYGTLIQATDGNLYGTTYYGGKGQQDYGTVFKTTLEGKLTALHKFETVDGGQYPNAGLVQDKEGSFYGTTSAGGTFTDCYGGSCGTLFRLTIGAAGSSKTSQSPAR
jgi:uncharacterized repeat protein (TIGR03803 family)